MVGMNEGSRFIECGITGIYEYVAVKTFSQKKF